MRGRVVVRPASLSFAAQMVDFCHLRVNAGDVLQLKQQYRGKEMLFRGCAVDPPMATLLQLLTTGPSWKAVATLEVTLLCHDPGKLMLAAEQEQPALSNAAPAQFLLRWPQDDDEEGSGRPFEVVSRGGDGSLVLKGSITSRGIGDNEPWPHEFSALRYCEDPRVPKVKSMVDAILRGVVAHEGVSWRDAEVSDALAASLNQHIDAVVANEAKDYHPRSKRVIRDIVHPALFPFIRGVSPFVPSPELSEVPRPLEGAKDMWGRPYERSLYQWLPTPFVIDHAGNCKIDTYINNLDRAKYRDLYTDLERLFEVFLPHFEAVVGFARRFVASMNDGDAHGHCTGEAVPPVSLTGQTLQVITKIVDYELWKGRVHSGVWHVEGMSHEHIIATGVYIAARSPCVQGGSLLFQRPFTPYEATMVNEAGNRNRGWLPELEEILRGDLVPVGHLPTPAGRLLVFPNSHVHKVSDVRAVGDNGKRRIVVFWLVDPDWRLVSTKEVPPQQGVMSRTDAKQHRLALMRHRRFHKQSRNVRVIELCEH